MDIIKVLGQLAAAATTEEDLYTAPDLSRVTCSSIVVANRTSSTITFRLSISVNDVSTTAKDYICYDIPINGNTVITMVLGFTLGQNDTFRTFASATGLSFNLFGVETLT